MTCDAACVLSALADASVRAEIESIVAQHLPEVEELEGILSVDPGSGEVILDGVNLHLRNGSGQTQTANALGNLILGYNDSNTNPADSSVDTDRRLGSHNLVVGDHHYYEGTGSVVFGEDNGVSGNGTSVLAGQQNQALGTNTAIVGGVGNFTAGNESVVVGGRGNVCSGHEGVILGGRDGELGTNQQYETVLGGFETIAAGTQYGIWYGGGDLQACTGP